MKRFNVLLLMMFSLILLPGNVYADQYPIGASFGSQVAVEGEMFEYTIKGYAGLDEICSSNLNGTIMYDEDVFKFIEVGQKPYPEMLAYTSGIEGTINTEILGGKIVFSYSLEDCENFEGERVDLTFVFKVKDGIKNSKSTIKYVPKEENFYFPTGIESEITTIAHEQANNVNSDNVSVSENDIIVYCSLGLSAILLVAFVSVLTKYLKLKKLG